MGEVEEVAGGWNEGEEGAERGQEGRGRGSAGEGVRQILSLMTAASLSPFNPWTCAGKIAVQVRGDPLQVGRLMQG